MKEDIYHRPISSHGGNKYVRLIADVDGEYAGRVDIYAVLKAYNVTCPGLQQAAKKILCAGLRGKGSRAQDIKEAMDALFRALQFAEADEAQEKLDKEGEQSKARTARGAGYEGFPCPGCAAYRMVRSGDKAACDGCKARFINVGHGWETVKCPTESGGPVP